ncbi:UNVERIFIED_CONTAM: tRNA lysidine(34) synthetase TilS [Prevotella sp. 15_C9]
MLSKVREYIKSFQLLDKEKLYLVALSGGADSVALLYVLHQLGYRLEIAHCNFRLREEESYRDEAFCKILAQKLNLPFHVIHFETALYAETHKVSVEMAARDLRYRYFANLLQDIGASGVCVAHHREDSIETILLNIIRGTGIKGLMGIRPKQGTIIRPLLNCTRHEIETFLRKNHQDFVTDSTNFNVDFKRNKVRNVLMPLLEEMNPSVTSALLKLSSFSIDANRIVEESISNYLSKVIKGDEDDLHCFLQSLRYPNLLSKPVHLDINSIEEFCSPDYLLYYIFSPFGFTPSQIEQISQSLGTQPGKHWQSESHELLIDRHEIIVSPLILPFEKEMKIPEMGTYIYSKGTVLKVKAAEFEEGFELPDGLLEIAIDRDKIEFPLLLRPWKKGDRFVPFGMNGTKLVSDFLTDIKMNVFEKRRQLVLCDAKARIVWVVGHRLDNRYRLTVQTRTILIIRCKH